MTNELIIEGQYVDLTGTPITLEWVSGLFSDIGSIQMSRSYTIQLPKTTKNVRIFDDPGTVGHESTKTRKYLSAEYIRNGVSLLGKNAKAYVMDVTEDAIEIGLLWNIVPGLLEWRESGKSLRDVPIGVKQPWVNSEGQPNYLDSTVVFFGKYYSGLGGFSYPTINAAPHLWVSTWLLLQVALSGIDSYRIFGAADRLVSHAVLCDGHSPNRQMCYDAGSRALTVTALFADNREIRLRYLEEGWDPVIYSGEQAQNFATVGTAGGQSTHYFKIQAKNQTPVSYSLLDNPIQVVGFYMNGYLLTERVLAEIPFVETDAGDEVAIAELTIGDLDDINYYRLRYKKTLPSSAYGGLVPAIAGEPILMVGRAREEISIANENMFPIETNLPDITCVDFVKGICALMGLACVIDDNTLNIVPYDQILDKTAAVDWTEKVISIRKVTRRVSDKAQKNMITYTEDVPVFPSADAAIRVNDTTLPAKADLFQLPFAASRDSEILHYNVTYERNQDTGLTEYKVEDVDVKPRIMARLTDTDGTNYLTFPDYFKGDDLIKTYYKRYQEILMDPVIIEADVRLDDIDLATLSFVKPVYLSQTGHYYAIMTVREDGEGISKVQLIKI